MLFNVITTYFLLQIIIVSYILCVGTQETGKVKYLFEPEKISSSLDFYADKLGFQY